jgi:UDP-N-acetylmuramoyl-tripeptide--D-alanyl-D-alanine ligase
MGMYALGDIRLLMKVARPRLGVVTAVQPIHLERLGSIERIQAAKQEMVEELPETGVAILNADDERVAAMAKVARGKVVTYGLSAHADLWAENIESQGLRGVEFNLVVGQRKRHILLPMLGAHSVHAALAAAAVGLELGMDLSEIAEGLHEVSPRLRLVIVDGINGSRVIDDSYNASPESVLAALNLLRELPGRHKIAVLGDMLELGSEEQSGHRRVGNRAARVVDLLILVGQRSRWTAEEARASGLAADRVIEAADVEEVNHLLRARLRPGDDVLVKGSRAMGLEQVVQAIRVGDRQ